MVPLEACLLAVILSFTAAQLFPVTLQRQTVIRPEIYSLHIESHIKYRYAVTKATSRVANAANVSQLAEFKMYLPETAFINSFQMTVDGKEYKAFIKERNSAKKEFQEAIKGGQTAAHISANLRDSNVFTISVNVEAGGKVDFQLIYEELLTRTLGVYSHVINLNPGQVVRDFQVDVYITETSNIKKLIVPELHSANEIIDLDNVKENGLAEVKMKKKNKAHVKFTPTPDQQKELIVEEKGGQFSVLYDVDRSVSPGGQILINDGYFVHFFSPPELKPLSKYAVFVLDVSGSMDGRKLEQLKEAMSTILGELSPTDYFNLIDFSSSVTVHDLDSATGSVVVPPESGLKVVIGPEEEEKDMVTPMAYPATAYYIERAKQVIEKMSSLGGTNIYDALKNSLLVTERGLDSLRRNTTDPIEPIILFLTDGDPTVGITNHRKILNMVKDFNNLRTSIFSLGFGEGADISFLRKLSLANAGFARTIYEASDAALQLNNFFMQIASPLLSNVTFTYIPGQIVDKSLTRSTFQSLFKGSEIIVAGKVDEEFTANNITSEIEAITADGHIVYNPSDVRDSLDDISEIEYSEIGEEKSEGGSKEKTDKAKKTRFTLERMWAYLSIRQMLDNVEAISEKNSTLAPLINDQILKMALKYKFVTPLTSLIVVKPNGTSEISSDSLKQGSLKNKFGSGGNLQSAMPAIDVEEEEEEEEPSRKLLWLPSVFNNNITLSLPTGENNQTEVYALTTEPNDEEFSMCEVSTSLGMMNGVCVHLYRCITAEISQTLEQYMKYFCPIPGGYAGVCCLSRRSEKFDVVNAEYLSLLLG